MIRGIGIDVVDIARFQETLDRTPQLRERLFTSREAALNISSLAARFAAKEALVKALNAKEIFTWLEAEVVNEESGRPVFIFTGALAERVDGASVHLSISHDAGIASAMVVVEDY
jgi:holo-[acyl-carrier protein] synthase